MYLQEVRIKNFRGFGENKLSDDNCYIFDDLDSDFVIFHGFNGFGKTSFYEAIEWCLTDSVKRYEKYNDNYKANELKRSHHLKFFHPLYGSQPEREVYCELRFSNGLQIIRKSNSISHKFGNADNYESEFIIKKDGIKLEIEDYLTEFGINSENLYQFLNTHFLGQENISSFLRDNSPEERKSIFMQLLNLNKLNFAYQEVTNLRGSGKIKRKKEQLIQELAANTQLLNKINVYIEKQNFKDVKDYLNGIKTAYFELKKAAANNEISNVFSRKFNEYLQSLSEIMIEDCFNLLNEVKKESTKLQKIQESTSESNRALKSKLDVLNVLKQLEEGKHLLKTEENYNFLLKNNFELINKRLAEVQKDKDDFIQKKERLVEKQSRLSFFILSKPSIENYIKINENAISNQFWPMLAGFETLVENFKREFIVELNESKADITQLSKIKLQNWDVSKDKYLKSEIKLQDTIQRLIEKENNIKKISNLNSQYTDALNSVKDYLINNEVDHCPVCLNSDFSDMKYSDITPSISEGHINQKILSIIDYTIGAGNDLMANEVQDSTILRNEKNAVEQEIKDVIANVLKSFNMIKGYYNQTLTKVETYLEIAFQSTIEKENVCLNEEKQVENRLKLLRSLYLEIFNLSSYEEIPKNDLTEARNKVNEKIEKWLQGLDTNYIEFITKPDLLTVNQKIKEIKDFAEMENTNSLNEEEVSVRQELSNGLKKHKSINQTLTYINKVLGYSLPEEFDDRFKDFYKLAKESEEIEAKIGQVDNYKDELDLIYQDLHELRNNAVENKLKKHPIIGWIYESINPHPFYQELSITNDGRGANFKDKTGTLYLDHIFSNAQLNILALSVFLGLGLSVEDNFNQLFLDDPIQSMDDVNTLALIDVFRGIMDSKFKKKKMIISTHDSNFARLLSIKMRNRKIVQYHFQSYTEEGPLIIKG